MTTPAERIMTMDEFCQWEQECLSSYPKNRRDEMEKHFLSFPDHPEVVLDFSSRVVSITTKKTAPQGLKELLRKFSPWRKGPFQLFDTCVDTEWDSSLKWDRLGDFPKTLKGKRVLDIGASSAYYMFRMVPHQPAQVLGIDGSLTYYFQFRILQKYARIPNLFYLPCRFEKMTGLHQTFDVIFSMGILYHQRHPVKALKQKQALLNPQGTLVLEGLYLEGSKNTFLVPDTRYAQMKNVYHIPTLSCLYDWLEQSGFEQINLLSLTQTRPEEQRRTEWIVGESLQDFLDPEDPQKTREGYPAPRRFLLTCQKK